MSGTHITVTVLAENTAGQRGVLGEHGLSLWIETPAARVLFDTGQGLVLARNAAALGAALDCADAIVLSHGHNDHTGGLLQAMEAAPGARLFLHPAARRPRFSLRQGQAREIGMPAAARAALAGRGTAPHWTLGPTEIAPGVFVSGPIPRRTGYEDTGGPFFLDAEGAAPDPLEDDQALWVETPGGAVVLAGCAHSGIVNTLDFIRGHAGRPIRALAGGLHLGAASDERLAQTIEALSRFDPTALWPCHCTGLPATARLLAAFGPRGHAAGAGTRIKF